LIRAGAKRRGGEKKLCFSLSKKGEKKGKRGGGCACRNPLLCAPHACNLEKEPPVAKSCYKGEKKKEEGTGAALSLPGNLGANRRRPKKGRAAENSRPGKKKEKGRKKKRDVDSVASRLFTAPEKTKEKNTWGTRLASD